MEKKCFDFIHTQPVSEREIAKLHRRMYTEDWNGELEVEGL